MIRQTTLPPDEPSLPKYIPSKGLTGSQRTKARTLVKLDKIAKMHTPDHWLILPIDGYNKTMYVVYKDKYNDYHCNCQWISQGHNICSHILAVMISEGDDDCES